MAWKKKPARVRRPKKKRPNSRKKRYRRALQEAGKAAEMKERVRGAAQQILRTLFPGEPRVSQLPEWIQ
jgi:hypothetical protein